jgi:hypothetical protein
LLGHRGRYRERVAALHVCMWSKGQMVEGGVASANDH